jgi:hypothetical protein
MESHFLHDLRDECKLGSGNTIPIILVSLWADQFCAGCDEVRCTVVVIMVMVCDLEIEVSRGRLFPILLLLRVLAYQKMGNVSVKRLANPFYGQLALMGWRVDDHNGIVEFCYQRPIGRCVVKGQMV